MARTVTLWQAVLETIRIKFIENILTKTKSHCRATAASRAYSTRLADRTAHSITTSKRRMVDIDQRILVYIAEKGWHLTTGMHFTVGKKRNKIKGGTAANTGTAALQRQALAEKLQIAEIVF